MAVGFLGLRFPLPRTPIFSVLCRYISGSVAGWSGWGNGKGWRLCALCCGQGWRGALFLSFAD